jgi:hypothetical protein
MARDVAEEELGMGPGGGAHDLPPLPSISSRRSMGKAAVAAVLPFFASDARDARVKTVPGHRWCGVKPT